MNGPTIQAFPVTCYGNKAGWFPAGISVNLDCKTTFVENTIVNPAAGSGDCSTIAAGGEWPNGAPNGVIGVAVAKVNTPDGYNYILTSDWPALQTHCNECCKN